MFITCHLSYIMVSCSSEEKNEERNKTGAQSNTYIPMIWDCERCFFLLLLGAGSEQWWIKNHNTNRVIIFVFFCCLLFSFFVIFDFFPLHLFCLHSPTWILLLLKVKIPINYVYRKSIVYIYEIQNIKLFVFNICAYACARACMCVRFYGLSRYSVGMTVNKISWPNPLWPILIYFIIAFVFSLLFFLGSKLIRQV